MIVRLRLETPALAVLEVLALPNFTLFSVLVDPYFGLCDRVVPFVTAAGVLNGRSTIDGRELRHRFGRRCCFCVGHARTCWRSSGEFTLPMDSLENTRPTGQKSVRADYSRGRLTTHYPVLLPHTPIQPGKREQACAPVLDAELASDLTAPAAADAKVTEEAAALQAVAAELAGHADTEVRGG